MPCLQRRLLWPGRSLLQAVVLLHVNTDWVPCS
jgi:hypothetical protein